jgi:hypothetical protein
MIISTAIGGKRVSNPFHGHAALLIANRYHVETARLRRTAAVQLQVLLRCAYDATLLGPGYCFGATAEAVVFAVANFSEYQTLTVFHDEVDFAHPAIEIARKSFQALAMQIHFSLAFPTATGSPGIGHHGIGQLLSPVSALIVVESNGTGNPRIKRANAGSRYNSPALPER